MFGHSYLGDQSSCSCIFATISRLMYARQFRLIYIDFICVIRENLKEFLQRTTEQ